MLKKVAGGLVIAFVLFYLISQPSGAAAAVKGALDATLSAFSAIGIFVNELIG